MATMTVWVKLVCFSLLAVSLEGQKTRGNCADVKEGQDQSIDKILGTWFTLFQSRPLDDCIYWTTERSGPNQLTLTQRQTIEKVKVGSNGSVKRLVVEWRDQVINTDHNKAKPILSMGHRNGGWRPNQLVIFNTNYPQYSVLLICSEYSDEEDQLLILTSDPLIYPPEEVKDWALRRVRDGGIDTSHFRLNLNHGCQAYGRPVQALPSDVPIKIWATLMPEDMVRDAMIAAVQAIEEFGSNHLAVAGSLSRKFPGRWQCIVGPDYGTAGDIEVGNAINFSVRQIEILLYKARCA